MGVTTGATWVSRNIGPSLPETLNVKNSPYNAAGNGTGDDSAAIQAALDAAAPGNVNNPVFIPAGTYNIGKTLLIKTSDEANPNVNRESTWIFGAGSALTKLLFTGHVPTNINPTFTNGSSNVGLTGHGYFGGEILVLQPTGDTLPTNFSFGIPYYVAVVNSNIITLAATLGGTAIVAGSAGSGTHKIVTPLVMSTGGYKYSNFEGMTLDISGAGTICLNLDGPIKTTNGDSFCDIIFKNASYGAACGLSGNMGSEMCFMDCEFHDHAIAGIYTGNFNALGIQVYNPSFINCGGYNPADDGHGAIQNSAGNTTIVAGVGPLGFTFKNSAFADIYSGGAEGKLVIDVTSTNSSTLLTIGGGGKDGPMFESANNFVFYQNVSYTAPNASGHDVTFNYGYGEIFINCNFPDGKFRCAGNSDPKPTDLIASGCTLGGGATSSFATDGSGFGVLRTTSTTPNTNSITPINLPYAIADFVLTEASVFSPLLGLRLRLHA